MPSTHVRMEYDAFTARAPGAYSALVALGKSTDGSGLDKGLIELAKLRASQLNGCAFCLQHHLNIARRLGVEPAKLDLLAAWRDAGVFSARECAALAWTEALTTLGGDAAPDEVYAAARGQFSADELAHLTVAIATINAWNRIGVGLRFAPPPPAGRGAG